MTSSTNQQSIVLSTNITPLPTPLPIPLPPSPSSPPWISVPKSQSSIIQRRDGSRTRSKQKRTLLDNLCTQYILSLAPSNNSSINNENRILLKRRVFEHFKYKPLKSLSNESISQIIAFYWLNEKLPHNKANEMSKPHEISEANVLPPTLPSPNVLLQASLTTSTQEGVRDTPPILPPINIPHPFAGELKPIAPTNTTTSPSSLTYSLTPTPPSSMAPPVRSSAFLNKRSLPFSGPMDLSVIGSPFISKKPKRSSFNAPSSTYATRPSLIPPNTDTLNHAVYIRNGLAVADTMSPTQIEQLFAEKSLGEAGVQCPICTESKAIILKYNSNCDHFGCVECVIQYILISMQSASFPTTCPGCKYDIVKANKVSSPHLPSAPEKKMTEAISRACLLDPSVIVEHLQNTGILFSPFYASVPSSSSSSSSSVFSHSLNAPQTLSQGHSHTNTRKELNVKTIISPQDLETILRWVPLQLKFFVGETLSSHNCPKCRSTSLLSSLDNKTARCGNPNCCYRFCALCGEKLHSNMSCDAYGIQKKNTEKSDKQSQEYISVSSKQCPRCGIWIQHWYGHGCHQMKCSKCAFQFCYYCLRSLSDHVRQHSGDVRCPLYCNSTCGCKVCEECKPRKPCVTCSGKCPTCSSRY